MRTMSSAGGRARTIEQGHVGVTQPIRANTFPFPQAKLAEEKGLLHNPQVFRMSHPLANNAVESVTLCEVDCKTCAQPCNGIGKLTAEVVAHRLV